MSKGRPHINLASELEAAKQTGNLPRAERADVYCRVAQQLEKAGEYEQAREALREVWPEHSEQPTLAGLDSFSSARVLLRAGALAGWLSSTQQAMGGQETAKNMLSQSIRMFEELGDVLGVAEGHSDLALCYWREGAFDEARINLKTALSRLDDTDETDLKAIVIVRAGLVEMTAGRLNEALRSYEMAAPLVEGSADHALKGSFHNGLGTLLNSMGIAERREDYIDRSLTEFAAASFHFEQAGHIRHQACVDINLAFLFFTVGRFPDAHRYLDRARNKLIELGDEVHLAQVNDTRARTLVAECRFDEAERFARSAIRTLEKGDEQALLAEALTTYGVVLARTGREPSARLQLQRAIEVAGTAGDLEGAGRAQLTLIEELGEQTSAKDLVSISRSAIDRLKDSQDSSTGKRLISCAARVFDTVDALLSVDQEPKEPTWEGFSLKRYIRDGERVAIERALREAGGSVTRASRLLGFKHHQSLISLIASRHKELLKKRSRVRKRKRGIVSGPKKPAKTIAEETQRKEKYQISVLHVEDNKQVVRSIADTLASEKFDVHSCANGTSALKILTSGARYDVIIVDNNLPGLSGLELVRRARNMARWRSTPIIMLSGDDCEKEAWRVHVDEFLRKPEDIEKISSTITRLLEERTGESD